MSRIIATVFVCLLAAVSVGAAQTLGSLEGQVQDATGAVIPGATITVTTPEGSAVAKQTANQLGRYAVMSLAPGKYVLEVETPGFNTMRLRVEVKPGKKAWNVVVLEVGSVTETIDVRGSAPILQTQVSGIAIPRGRRGRKARSASVLVSTEDYAHISENRFHKARRTPLSTFSIDVDTASYANVRRFLKDGTIPPKDAVRIEELVNYFRYDDPAPEGETPFSISTEVAECPWNAKNKIARIGLRSQAVDAKDLPPANLVFLLDVSGSMMSEDKLPLLKKGFALLTEQLRPEDRVAIVAYAGASGLVLPSTPGSKKDVILAALDRLQAGGSTAGAAGIRQAYATARENFFEHGNNRVILATDGDFNVGVSTDSELIRLIETERDEGVFLSVLGFGTGNLKDSKMEKLADHGNGQYGYVDSMLEARRQLVEQIGATLLTVAKDVKLQVEFNPARVARYRLVGYENRLLADEDFDDDKKDAGDMGAGHVVTALYEIEPTKADKKDDAEDDGLRYQVRDDPKPGTQYPDELFHVRIRYKDPRASRSRLLSVVAKDADTAIEAASDRLRFSAAVAEFGMLLRESEFRADASYEQAAKLADGARGEDADGRRSELVFLIKTAARLSKQKTVSQSR